VAKIGISSFKTLILVVVPLGLLLCWGFSQCLVTSIKRSRREMSSNLIAFVLIIFHLVGLAEYVVYIMVNTTENLDYKVNNIQYSIKLKLSDPNLSSSRDVIDMTISVSRQQF